MWGGGGAGRGRLGGYIYKGGLVPEAPDYISLHIITYFRPKRVTRGRPSAHRPQHRQHRQHSPQPTPHTAHTAHIAQRAALSSTRHTHPAARTWRYSHTWQQHKQHQHTHSMQHTHSTQSQQQSQHSHMGMHESATAHDYKASPVKNRAFQKAVFQNGGQNGGRRSRRTPSPSGSWP